LILLAHTQSNIHYIDDESHKSMNNVSSAFVSIIYLDWFLNGNLSILRECTQAYSPSF
jgi:hypothetical protein